MARNHQRCDTAGCYGASGHDSFGPEDGWHLSVNGTSFWVCWNCGSTDGTRSHVIAGEEVTECRDCGAEQ